MTLFHLANLPYWVLLGIGILLFAIVIFAGGGEEDLDADLDADSDADFSNLEILGWLGVGEAPLILLLAADFSLWGIIGWMLNVWIGSISGTIPANFWGWGGAVLIGSLLASLLAGSLIARPIGKIFAAFGEDASGDRLIGAIGTVSSARILQSNLGKIGQVDVIDRARNLVIISAALPEWATIVPRRGDRVIIIDRQLQAYIVIAKDSLDEERWLADNGK